MEQGAAVEMIIKALMLLFALLCVAVVYSAIRISDDSDDDEK